MQKEGKPTGEINITTQIDKMVRKKKPLDSTPSLELAAPVEWAPPGNSKKLVQTVCTSMLVTGCALSPIPAAMPSCWNYLGFVSEP